jgi:uncharacterized membrane protein YdbT with pleckstrin-like domain
MSYVDDHLLPGEEVIYRAHLHRTTVAGPYILGVLFLGGAVTAAVLGQGLLALIPAAFGVGAFVWAHLVRRSSEFAVTNKRVVIKVGIVQRRTLETMLGKVEGIGVDQTFLGRLVGRGTLVVTGTGGTREEFHSIADPLEFRRQVQAQVAEVDDRRLQASYAMAPPDAVASARRTERECPFCAEPILAKAKVCKHCGRDVGPMVAG